MHVPVTNFGWLITFERKGIVVVTPLMNVSSASRILAIASARSAPCTISLAIIES